MDTASILTRHFAPPRQRYEAVEVPFKLMGNRKVLTAAQVVEHPWLHEFIQMFRYCFEFDAFWDIWVYQHECVATGGER